MSLEIRYSEWFAADLEHYTEWFDKEAGWEIAERYLRSVDTTLRKLAKMPALGHLTAFSASELQGIRCFSIERPFYRHFNLLSVRRERDLCRTTRSRGAGPAEPLERSALEGLTSKLFIANWCAFGLNTPARVWLIQT